MQTEIGVMSMSILVMLTDMNVKLDAVKSELETLKLGFDVAPILAAIADIKKDIVGSEPG